MGPPETVTTVLPGTPLPVEAATARAWLGEMMFIRRFEEKSAELYGKGRIRGFLHLSVGQEAVCVGVMQAMGPEDNIVSTYRDHGHALSRGIPPGPVMAELFGKVNGTSRGRGGSMHLFDVGRRFFGGYAIVGGGLPIAVGLALADRLAKRPAVTLCLFGDGAVAEGEFHESLNLASLWKLPVLFVCENNYYAMGTALERHQAETDITRKGSAYRVPARAVDGMDLLAVVEAARETADLVRSSGSPYLLECRTYRFRAHSMYDAELYRTKEEVAVWKRRDPILLFSQRLEAAGALDAATREELEQEAERRTMEAVAFAEAGGWEPVEDLTRDVYAGDPPC